MIANRTRVRVIAGLSPDAWGLSKPAEGTVMGHENLGNLVLIDLTDEPDAHGTVATGVLGDGLWWFNDWQLEVI